MIFETPARCRYTKKPRHIFNRRPIRLLYDEAAMVRCK